MDSQNKSYNLMTAATSLNSWEFDFGNLSATGKERGATAGGSSLKQQKLGAQPSTPAGAPAASSRGLSSGAPIKPPVLAAAALSPNFRPMAAPWEVAAERMKTSQGTETVVLAPTVTLQTGFKEKEGSAAPNSGSFSASWMSSTVTSPFTGGGGMPGPTAAKPDALASLWSSATKGGTPAAVSSSAAAAVDPFELLSISGKPNSLAAMKKGSPSPQPNGATGISTTPLSTAAASAAAQSPATASFDAFAASPNATAPAGAAPAPAGFDPFGAASFSNPTGAAPVPAAPAASAAGVAAPVADPFAAFDSTTAPGPAAALEDPFAAFPGTGATASAPFDAFGSAATARPPAANPAQSPVFSDFDAIFGSASAQPGQPATPQTAAKAPLDPLEALLMKPPPAPATAAASFGATGTSGSNHAQPVQDAADWGGLGGGGEPGATVELEEIPPPPLGLTASAAVEKGEQFYKAGQFADAIKWLLWAESLAGPAGGAAADQGRLHVRILSVRASCYKEAGEMKKAVADCTKVLELEPGHTGALMQRALLYEGMEKYGKGAADLRELLTHDPGNRPAMTLLNRLAKMG